MYDHVNVYVYQYVMLLTLFIILKCVPNHVFETVCLYEYIMSVMYYFIIISGVVDQQLYINK